MAICFVDVSLDSLCIDAAAAANTLLVPVADGKLTGLLSRHRRVVEQLRCTAPYRTIALTFSILYHHIPLLPSFFSHSDQFSFVLLQFDSLDRL